MPSFSVVVTAYNLAPLIGRTLDSVRDAISALRQTAAGAGWTPEVVVVDDGSTDGTADVVDGYLREPGWQLVRRAAPTSAACARNAGVARSSGEALFFLDGDDLFLPHHLSVCLQALQGPAVDYVKTGVRLADPVHPDWKPRIENSLAINLCVRRACHDFLGGFPDFHLSRRADDRICDNTDIFYAMEDDWYNQIAQAVLRRRKVRCETVEYCRRPGNAYDRLYEKFRLPFGQYQDSPPAGLRFRLRLAEVIFQEEVGRLRREAEAAGRGAPAKSAELLAAALRLYNAGDVRRAEQGYRQAAGADPANAQAWYLLGAACQALGRPADAADALREALRLEPDFAEAHNQLGAALARQWLLTEASEAFREALRHQPDFDAASANLARVLKELERPGATS
jgi:glycosyltransferase involved in cell wall biosynthesis